MTEQAVALIFAIVGVGALIAGTIWSVADAIRDRTAADEEWRRPPR